VYNTKCKKGKPSDIKYAKSGAFRKSTANGQSLKLLKMKLVG
jgi:hypothetical protein